MPTIPPPSGVTPGDLRVDSTSRTLWLGVEAVVDPAGALLIADILDTMTKITAAETNANAYTDSAVATRALLAHTHPHTDITDFSSAVIGVVNGMTQLQWIPGMITLWSGPLTAIGSGALAGWALCNGANGTPDLRERFVLGAGTRLPNVVPGNPPPVPTPLIVPQDGQHAHVATGTAISIAQMPAHLHADGTLAGVANGNTGPGGAHDHTYTYSRAIATGNGLDGTLGSVASTTGNTSTEPAHTHPITNVPVAITGNTANTGGGGSHTHTIQPDGVHTHTIPSDTLRASIPYYALAYIMKL